MRIPAIAANWKMFKTTHETLAYVRELSAADAGRSRASRSSSRRRSRRSRRRPRPRATRRWASPRRTSTSRRRARSRARSAPAMIKDAGAGYVIIGHSERRRLFGETDASVNRKVRAALGAELVPIVCVGETLEEREGGPDAGRARPPDQGRARRTDRRRRWPALIIAYEPVWAIGTGKTASPAEADEAHRHIRTRLRQWFGGDGGRSLPHPVRRVGQARQHQGPHGAARRRRRARRRRQPHRAELPRHRTRVRRVARAAAAWAGADVRHHGRMNVQARMRLCFWP